MPSLEYDLAYLRAGLASLEEYLLSNEVYWPVGAAAPVGEPAFPRLTLGNLRLAQMRVQALSQTPAQQAGLTKHVQELDAMRTRWRVAWEQKATREFHARLNLWRDFLEEYRASPDNNADRYTYEVQRRVMLELLSANATGAPQAELDLLSGLDQLLKAVFVPGEFVWDSTLQAGFPHTKYWFLYGRLKKS